MCMASVLASGLLRFRCWLGFSWSRSYIGQARQGWEKSYLRVMMLAWPLGEEEASSRSVGLDIVTRKGGTCRVMFGRHRWCNGVGFFRELAWPSKGWKASTRGVRWDMIYFKYLFKKIKT